MQKSYLISIKLLAFTAEDQASPIQLQALTNGTLLMQWDHFSELTSRLIPTLEELLVNISKERPTTPIYLSINLLTKPPLTYYQKSVFEQLMSQGLNGIWASKSSERTTPFGTRDLINSTMFTLTS